MTNTKLRKIHKKVMVIWIYHTVTGDMFIFLLIFFTLFHVFDSNQHIAPLSNNVPNSWQIPEHPVYGCSVHEVNSHYDQYPSITWSCLFTATPLPYCVSCQAQFNVESCKPSYIGNMPQFNLNNITAHKSTNQLTKAIQSLQCLTVQTVPLIKSPSIGNYKFVCWHYGCYFAADTWAYGMGSFLFHHIFLACLWNLFCWKRPVIFSNGKNSVKCIVSEVPCKWMITCFNWKEWDDIGVQMETSLTKYLCLFAFQRGLS